MKFQFVEIILRISWKNVNVFMDYTRTTLFIRESASSTTARKFKTTRQGSRRRIYKEVNENISGLNITKRKNLQSIYDTIRETNTGH